jgi:hypothetical protein
MRDSHHVGKQEMGSWCWEGETYQMTWYQLTAVSRHRHHHVNIRHGQPARSVDQRIPWCPSTSQEMGKLEDRGVGKNSSILEFLSRESPTEGLRTGHFGKTASNHSAFPTVRIAGSLGDSGTVCFERRRSGDQGIWGWFVHPWSILIWYH